MPQGGFLIDVLVLLLAAVISVPVFARLRVGPVLGYLVAGVIIGPAGLRLVDYDRNMQHLAELGVVFLLFAIGLELKLARLMVMRRLVFGLGAAQVVATGAVIAAVALAAGLGAGAAVVAGGALALSSTALVLQLLTERGELTSRTGRIAFAILLMQDLAVAPLLALVGLLGGETPSTPGALLQSAAQAVAALAAIVVGGRYLLRPLLSLVARSGTSEIFAAAAVLVVLGTAWVAAQVGLSMALGAFLAGLLLAESEFRHQVEADVQPFRGFLLGLFFMTVGMSIDLGMLIEHGPLVFAALLTFLTLKALAIVGLCRIFGIPRRNAIPVALLLAQGGEFAFVLLSLAERDGIMASRLAQSLILVVSLSMAVTPVLVEIAFRLRQRLAAEPTAALPIEIGNEPHDHVVIAGFGRVGQTVARLLQARGVAYVALDLNAERVSAAVARGMPVYYADASLPEVLRHAGAERALAVVVTLDHPGRVERAVSVLRRLYPTQRIYVRARDRRHGTVLRAIGASAAVPETLEASLQLGAAVLRGIGAVGGSEVEGLLDSFRAEDYARLGPVVRGSKEEQGEA